MNIYQMVSQISLLIGLAFLAVAAVLWFILRIPAVLDDLSGKTTRKQIDKLRRENERQGRKRFYGAISPLPREAITESIELDGGAGATVLLWQDEGTSLLTEAELAQRGIRVFQHMCFVATEENV